MSDNAEIQLIEGGVTTLYFYNGQERFRHFHVSVPVRKHVIENRPDEVWKLLKECVANKMDGWPPAIPQVSGEAAKYWGKRPSIG